MDLDELADYFERIGESRSRIRMYAILGELFENATVSEIAKVAWLCEGRVLPAFTGVEIGMAEQLLLQAIASAASRNPEEIHRLYKKLGDPGLVVENVMPAGRGKRLSLSAAYNHLVRIARTAGPGSVNRKIQLLGTLLRQCSANEGRWVVRFVSGGLERFRG